MKVALVYPPTADPTAPYLSVPSLAGYLRAHGVEVLPVDANLEAWEALLTRDSLAALAERLERSLARLEGKAALSHPEQLIYAALWSARGEAAAVPGAIGDALAVLRDPERFYDPRAYGEAVATVEGALRLISAASAPLQLDFLSYRTPFSLLNPAEIARDAAPERDPFHAVFGALAERLKTEGVGLVGVSVAFPGQVQPAFSLAHLLQERLPGVHLTVGGPALTQLLLRLPDDAQRERVLGPFHTAVAGEGEEALLELVRGVERGEGPGLSGRGRVLAGRRTEDLGELPPPDFAGLPLGRYLSPEPVLPYDPTRGCYWGRCAFCHYGLAETGTAPYRERPAEQMVAHLGELSRRWGARVFYLSEDALAPRTAARLARGLRTAGLELVWATDLRPERGLSPELCRELVDGGALAVSLGIESASPRVLARIGKGISPAEAAAAVRHLAGAGVAVEAMCFLDFPGETSAEARETLGFLGERREDLALFVCGHFELTWGSVVAREPEAFGLREVWSAVGDELRTGLFYQEAPPHKAPEEAEELRDAVDELSAGWWLHRYPWAGSLSTAHTLLWYRRHGPGVFRRLAHLREPRIPGSRPATSRAAFDVGAVAESSAEREEELWEGMVYRDRQVSRAVYEERADALPLARPSPGEWRTAAGEPPWRVRPGHRGRR